MTNTKYAIRSSNGTKRVVQVQKGKTSNDYYYRDRKKCYGQKFSSKDQAQDKLLGMRFGRAATKKKTTSAKRKTTKRRKSSTGGGRGRQIGVSKHGSSWVLVAHPYTGRIMARQLYKLNFTMTGQSVPVVKMQLEPRGETFLMQLPPEYLDLDASLRCGSESTCKKTLSAFRAYFNPMNPFRFQNQYPLDVLQVAQLINFDMSGSSHHLDLMGTPSWLKFLIGDDKSTSDINAQYEHDKFLTEHPEWVKPRSPYELYKDKHNHLVGMKKEDLEDMGLYDRETQRNNMKELYEGVNKQYREVYGGLGIGEGGMAGGLNPWEAFRYGQRNRGGIGSGGGGGDQRSRLLKLRKLINDRKRRLM